MKINLARGLRRTWALGTILWIIYWVWHHPKGTCYYYLKGVQCLVSIANGIVDHHYYLYEDMLPDMIGVPNFSFHSWGRSIVGRTVGSPRF